MAVHNIPERIKAERAGVDLIFVSPVFATLSHANISPLGLVRFAQITRDAKVPVIALGGITHKKAKSLRRFRLHGWAAIDGLAR